MSALSPRTAWVSIVLPVWVLAVVQVSGCGQKSDTGVSCGAEACPGGTRPITFEADGTCRATCEPLQTCPSWAVPVMTDACFACTTVMSDGRSFTVTQPLGDSIEYATCDGAVDPEASLTILRYAMSASVDATTASVNGHATLTWSDASDTPICTASFRLDSEVDETAPTGDDGIDQVLAVRHVMDGGLTDEGCVGLDLEVLSRQVERLDHAWFWLGVSASWTDWMGKAHDNVVFRLDHSNAYVDGDWYPWLQAVETGDTLSFDVLFGTAADVVGSNQLPVSGSEHWLWAEGDTTCDETFFVVGAWPVTAQASDVLYEVLLARAAGSTGCTSGIWRTTRGVAGGLVTTTDDLGAEVELVPATMTDASVGQGGARVQATWTDYDRPDGRTSGLLFFEL